MAGIPSDIAGSALQAGFHARNVSRVRDADLTGQADASKRQAQALDEAATSVETSDNDVAVFSDAAGQGSQGRPFEEEPAPDDDAVDRGDEAAGISRNTDGTPHLDIKA